MQKNVCYHELERRGLHFARYADDCVIFVKTKYSAERVMKNIITFIETKLKLKVNAEKTHITRPNNLKYLGFSFWKDKGEWKSKPHKESFKKLFVKLKKLVNVVVFKNTAFVRKERLIIWMKQKRKHWTLCSDR